MKRSKILICYYLITLLLAIISLFSFNQKGKDFFIALSSLSADITLIVSVVIIIYSLFYCCNYIKEKIEKKDKNINKKIIISLLILLSTLLVVFISFINIYSHKTIIQYIKELIDKKENTDILYLFINSILVYFSIFMCAIVGIIIGYKNNNDEKIDRILLFVTIFVIILFILRLLFNLRLLYIFITTDVVLYISIFILLKPKRRKKKDNH